MQWGTVSALTTHKPPHRQGTGPAAGHFMCLPPIPHLILGLGFWVLKHCITLDDHNSIITPVLFYDSVSLSNADYHETHHMDQVGFELTVIFLLLPPKSRN